MANFCRKTKLTEKIAIFITDCRHQQECNPQHKRHSQIMHKPSCSDHVDESASKSSCLAVTNQSHPEARSTHPVCMCGCAEASRIRGYRDCTVSCVWVRQQLRHWCDALRPQACIDLRVTWSLEMQVCVVQICAISINPLGLPFWVTIIPFAIFYKIS